MRKALVFFLFFCLILFILFSIAFFIPRSKVIINPLSKFQPTPTLTPTNIPTPTLRPTQISTPTPSLTLTPTPTPIQIGSNDLNSLFEKYSAEYSVDKNLLVKIADCESNLNPNAISSFGYVGLFQFSESLWVSTRTRMGKDSNPSLRTNAEESIKTASLLISEGRQSVWPHCSK